MSLRDQFLTAAHGDATGAAVSLARALMAGDPSALQAGYSQLNAVIAATELFPEVSSEDIHRGIDARLDERAARRSRLVEHFAVEPWALESGDLDDPARRYAAVTGIGEYEDAHLSTFNDIDSAFDFLAESILDGQAPDGVYDLDTAEKIEIEVSTPIVTASSHQRGRRNPLRA